MANIVLKIDIDTLQGTLKGVPQLLDLLSRASVSATFLFSLGPDHTGWALRRIFRPGFLKKVSRTSVVSHYGLKTLLYGVLLPGPDIGKKAAAIIKEVSNQKHEAGVHCWDHVLWQDNVRAKNQAWTAKQMTLARNRFIDIFGHVPTTFGSAGWQTNIFALQQLDDWQVLYASDGRGTAPYRIDYGSHLAQHIQIPTTLPTCDELLGTNGIDENNLAQSILNLTENDQDQVFTLHAELEGMQLASVFSTLLMGWKAQGHQLLSMEEYFKKMDCTNLPSYPLSFGTVAGRSGLLMTQTPSNSIE